MSSIAAILAAQQAAHRREPVSTYAQRRADLETLKRLLNENAEAIVDAARRHSW